MKNNENLKKQILYRSTYRGRKEMDLLLGNFVKKYINNLDDKDLNDLNNLLVLEDETIFNWYYKKNSRVTVPNTKISKLLKNFKL